ncbi:hypothetical protein CsSME_00040852 [Camellia sinensis var. sinensis]
MSFDPHSNILDIDLNALQAREEFAIRQAETEAERIDVRPNLRNGVINGGDNDLREQFEDEIWECGDCGDLEVLIESSIVS